MAKRSKKDIEKMGQRYRTMPVSLSQSAVAQQLNVPLSTLRGYIDKLGWERDLAPEVQRRTNIAVMKAALGADLNRPLNDEEQAIQERVALNVAIIQQHQEWLTGFGASIKNLLQHHVTQSEDLKVAVPDKDAPSGYRVVTKNLGPAIGESRMLIDAFSRLVEQQRLAYGIKADGDGSEVDVDSYLRELAEEMQQEEAQSLIAEG